METHLGSGAHYLGIITWIQFEDHVVQAIASRRHKLHMAQRNAITSNQEGRAYISIQYSPHRPILSLEEAAIMVDTSFQNTTKPIPVSLKHEGLKVEFMSDLSWGCYIGEPQDGKWPSMLAHPTIQGMTYLYLVGSRFTRQKMLCRYCHQASCKGSKHQCKAWRQSQQPPPSHKQPRYLRGYISLKEAVLSVHH